MAKSWDTRAKPLFLNENNSSGKWFIDSFQANCPETLSDLKELVLQNKTNFINNLSYYNKRVKGSSSYWYQKGKNYMFG